MPPRPPTHHPPTTQPLDPSSSPPRAGLAATCAASSSSANRSDERQSNGSKDGEYHDAAGCHSDAAIVLHLDLDELAEEAADSMREKLQLTAEEWYEWKEQKEGCLSTADTSRHAANSFPRAMAGWTRSAIGSASF